jgi:hypothetical protein
VSNVAIADAKPIGVVVGVISDIALITVVNLVSDVVIAVAKTRVVVVAVKQILHQLQV